MVDGAADEEVDEERVGGFGVHPGGQLQERAGNIADTAGAGMPEVACGPRGPESRALV